MGLKITLSGQTIVKPTALGPVANTDTKLLIYGAISKGPSFGTGRGSYSPTPSVLYSAGDPTVELLPQTGRPDIWQGVDYTSMRARVQAIRCRRISSRPGNAVRIAYSGAS